MPEKTKDFLRGTDAHQRLLKATFELLEKRWRESKNVIYLMQASHTAQANNTRLPDWAEKEVLRRISDVYKRISSGDVKEKDGLLNAEFCITPKQNINTTNQHEALVGCTFGGFKHDYEFNLDDAAELTRFEVGVDYKVSTIKKYWERYNKAKVLHLPTVTDILDYSFGFYKLSKYQQISILRVRLEAYQNCFEFSITGQERDNYISAETMRIAISLTAN